MNGSLNHSFAIGEFEVHPSLNQLAHQGKAIRVTPKVMQVLLCLAQRPNQAVTRDELLDSAWPDVAVNEDVLTSAISELRRIFQDSPRSPAVIETIPKIGYRLIAPLKAAPASAALPEVEEPVGEPATQARPAKRWLLAAALATAALLLGLAIPWPGLTSSDAALQATSPPSSAPPIHFRELKAPDYYQEGVEQLRLGHYRGNENAIALFKKAIEADPDFALAYAGLADGFSQRVSRFGQPSQWADLALENAQKAVRLAPQRPEGYEALGLAYANRGMRQAALKHLGRAVQTDPSHFPSVYHLALLHHRLGDLANAVIWLKRAWQLDTGHPGIMSLLGEIHSQLDDYDQAALWFERAIEIEPMQGRHHAGLGTVALLRGQREGVTEGCRRILQTFPNDSYCLLWVGEAELILGNRTQARHAFELSYRGGGHPQYARFRLGQIAWLEGDRKEAKQLFDQTLAEQLERVNRLENGGDWSDNWIVAAIHAVQGNRDEAFVWLERTRKAGRTHSGWDSIEPAFSQLRSDPRFDRYLAALKEKGDAIRTAIREAENPSLARH